MNADDVILISVDDHIAEPVAAWILRAFGAYYEESRGIPDRAKQAFENRDHRESLRLSRRRLSVYSESIHALAPRIDLLDLGLLRGQLCTGFGVLAGGCLQFALTLLALLFDPFQGFLGALQ